MAYKFEIKKVDSLDFDAPVYFTEQDRKVEPFAFLESFREMGWKNFRRGQYEQATRNFNIALGLYPDDVRTLIGRGNSRCKNLLFEGALKDAETVLAQNEFNKEAIYLQALSEYELGNFEEALMAFHKGMNKRRKRPMFRDGRYQAEGTIEDCVGRYAGPALTEMKQIIKKMEILKVEESKKIKEKCSVDNLTREGVHTCSEIDWNLYCRQQDKLYSVMAEIYLGRLNLDRKWLNQTLKDPAIKSPNKTGTTKIINLLTSVEKDINKRQEILRERKPYYHVKNKRKFAKVKPGQEEQLSKVLNSVCLKLLNRMKHERFLKNTKNCEVLAFVTREQIEKCPRRLLPAKNEMIFEICNIMGKVYLDRWKLKPDLSKRENNVRIVSLLGFDIAFNEQKLDPIIQESDFCFSNLNNVMKMCESYLEVSKLKLEQIWLHFTIGRCYASLRKFEYAVVKAKKCVLLAKQMNNIVWVINALFMQIFGLMREKNKDDAFSLMKECHEYARLLDDQHVSEFMDMCVVAMREKELREVLLSPNQIVEKRENIIIDLINNPHDKDYMIRMLNRMRVLPANRRMSIIPGMMLQNQVGYNPGLRSMKPNSEGGRYSVHVTGKTTYKEFIES